MPHQVDLRSDGWWIRFPDGEEAGPFESIAVAEAFLDYVDEVQRRLKENLPPDALPPSPD